MKTLTCCVLIGIQGALAYIPFSNQIIKRQSVGKQYALTSDVEVSIATTPKVPTSAWRFPPKWPFPADYLDPTSNTTIDTKSYTNKAYSGLNTHISNYISASDSIIEFNALSSPVVSTEKFPKLQHYQITRENMINSNAMLPFPSSSFDHALFTGGIEYLSEPRDFFREIWRVLKPGGRCFVSFLEKPIPVQEVSPLQMWTTMTEEQKIWIAGSYFNYSSKFGWSSIEGYDLFSSTGDKGMVFEKKDDIEHLYVVQSEKAVYTEPTPSTMTQDELYEYLYASMQGLRNIGCNSAADASYSPDTVTLIAYRLTSMYFKTDSIKEKQAILNDYPIKMIQIFDILKDVKEVVMPTPVKVMLASFLVTRWVESDYARMILKQGVGLYPVSSMDPELATFWTQLANTTSVVQPRDKIALLGDMIPYIINEQSTSNSERIYKFPVLLQTIVTLLESRFKDITSRDAVCVSADIGISDYLYCPLDISSEQAIARIISYLNKIDKARLDQLIEAGRVEIFQETASPAAN